MFKIIIVSCILAVVCINLQTVEAGFIPNPLSMLNNVKDPLSMLNNVKDPASNVLGMVNWNNKISEKIQEELIKISKKAAEDLKSEIPPLKEKNKELMKDAESKNVSACCKTYDYAYIYINELTITLYECILTEVPEAIKNTVDINGLTKKVQEIALDAVVSKVSNPLDIMKDVPNILKTMKDKDAFSILEKVASIAMKVQPFWTNLGTCLSAGLYKARDSQNRVIESIVPCATSLLKS